MKNPRLKFQLNKILDKQICFRFLNLKHAGIDFGKTIISNHPQLKNIKNIKSAVQRKKEISKYIDNFYEKRGILLKESLILAQKEWKLIENKFFLQTDKIFDGFLWPKGKYIAYLSIFNCNPRFLRDKTFQVFYKNTKEWKRIISHEFLHFVFYGYLNKNFKTRLPENKKWVISEIFNMVILNQKDFKKIISPSKESGYPEHKKYIKTLTNEWKKNKNIDKWLKTAIKVI